MGDFFSASDDAAYTPLPAPGFRPHRIVFARGSRTSPGRRTMAERGQALLDHYAALLQQYGEDDALRYMQHVGSMYARDMPGAQAAIRKARSADDLRRIAAEWFR